MRDQRVLSEALLNSAGVEMTWEDYFLFSYALIFVFALIFSVYSSLSFSVSSSTSHLHFLLLPPFLHSPFPFLPLFLFLFLFLFPSSSIVLIFVILHLLFFLSRLCFILSCHLIPLFSISFYPFCILSSPYFPPPSPSLTSYSPFVLLLHPSDEFTSKIDTLRPRPSENERL
jgi:hypothetical protein